METKEQEFVTVHGKTKPIYEKVLSLPGMGLKSLDEIAGLDDIDNLRGVILYQNKIKDISPLMGHGDLEFIHMARNSIKRMPDFSPLENLKVLDLSYNQISKIEGLENASKLECLSLSSNRLTSTKGLENCLSLKRLYINHNEIGNLEGLGHLEELYEFEINHNKLESLDGLPKNRLNYFEASSNRIKRVKLWNMHGHESVIDLSANQIEEVELPDDIYTASGELNYQLDFMELVLSGNKGNFIKIGEAINGVFYP